jgi:hypothetical protein
LRRPLLLLTASCFLVGPALANPPPEDQCPSISGPLGPGISDAVPRRLERGQRIGYDSLPGLRELVPHEVWQQRHIFFFQGMTMVIGDCHRRYAVPEFFSSATQHYAGRAKIDRKGNLQDYVAGLPFPPETIDPDSPQAGVKWAWNLENRFRGAGPVGNFRLVDVAPRIGKNHTYEGSFFLYQTLHRTDLAESEYSVKGSSGDLWVAGGRFLKPQSARHLAWRQVRPQETQEEYSLADHTFVYVPTMRKVRRSATPWVDGIYVPRYSVAGDSGGGGMPIGGDSYTGAAGSLNPTSALSVQQTENIGRGFTGLALRPNAYVWRVLGEREIIAPINIARPGYPAEKQRNFGPHGLSVANDRWDVRWAVVLEGRIRMRNHGFESVVLYVDWQTQQPLYVIKKGSRGRLLDVGIPVHRFSDDVVNYPSWPDGERASVFDPVAEVFYSVPSDSGWRRESYDVKSTPAEERIRRRFTSTSFLVRGR